MTESLKYNLMSFLFYRRMFPSMRVQVTDLDPHKDYCFLVEMVPVTKCRYRYSAATGWAPAGAEEAHSPNRFYIHPESPAPGAHWMSQAVSFGRLKLTNMSNAPAGHVVMASMHKYQPRIHVVEASDLRNIFDYAPKVVVDFAETQFIAVTAYQNDKMTKMKIDHNPFAKGFRESGQSKCKRKRQRMEQEKQEEKEQKDSSVEEDVDVVGVGDVEEITQEPKKHVKHAPLDVSSDSGMSDCDSSMTASPSPSNYIHQQSHRQLHHYPYTPYFYQYPFALHPATHFNHSLYSSIHMSRLMPQDLSVSKRIEDEPRNEIRPKFTDFSIRAITGLV